MPPKSRPASATTDENALLVEATQRLGDEVRMLRDVFDEIREELTWLMRNGLPIQPIEHVVVHRMALDSCDKDWAKKLTVERFAVSDSAASPLSPDMLDRVAEDLKATLEAVAQGQLEVVLTALDGVRGELLTALKRRRDPPPAPDESPLATALATHPVAAAKPPNDRPQPGRLF